MKKIILSLAFLSLTSLGFAQEKGIKFEKSFNWKQVRAKAKAENKYIFLDLFATWCGPCKVMDREVYPSEGVGSFMNDKFISAKVQADQTKNDIEEVKNGYLDIAHIVSEYNISAFPSFLFFSPEGQLVNRAVGFQNAESFVEIAKSTFELSKQFAAKIEVYKSGKMNVLEMKELAVSIKTAGDNNYAQIVADDCINNHLIKLKKSELFTSDNLIFIGRFIGHPKSKAFSLYTKNSKEINAVLGPYAAEKRIMGFIEKTYFPDQATWKTNAPDWDVLEKNATKNFGALGQEIALGNRMIYHWLLADDWKSFGNDYVKYFQVALKHPVFHVNNMSWAVFEHVNDPKILAFAIEVMKYDIETFDQNDPVALDTYANLLHKVGRTKEAIEWENKAVKIVKGQPGNHLYVEALDKMLRGEKTWKDTASN